MKINIKKHMNTINSYHVGDVLVFSNGSVGMVIHLTDENWTSAYSIVNLENGHRLVRICETLEDLRQDMSEMSSGIGELINAELREVPLDD